jgi:glycerate-2-kinase
MKETLEQQYKVLSQIPELVVSDDEKKVPFEIEDSIQGKIYLVAVGKGSLKMASQIVEKYGNQVYDGIVISGDDEGFISDKIQIFGGSHPVPDSNTVAASYEVLDFVRRIPAGNTLIFCISGGTSSMLTIPPFGIEIDEIKVLYNLLLKSGASIHEMNIVRKHVCDLKGGKLAEEIEHINLISLIESDVPGDEISTIGSGPTVADPSTFVEAVQILKNLEIWDSVPVSIQEHLICGVEGYIPENPKPDEFKPVNHTTQLLSSSETLKKRLAKYLEGEGYNTWIRKEAYSGSVQQVAKEICGKAISILSGNNEIKKPAALIYLGESTVLVKGNGKGGRNQELALMVALSIEGQHSISLLSMDTDGIDGTTDVAGAIVNSNTTLLARKNKVEPEKLLSDNNSYEFHKKSETHLRTGPTGINLMDLQIVLID